MTEKLEQDVKQKLEVVNYASSLNVRVAAKHYYICRTTIVSWSHQVEALRSQSGYGAERKDVSRDDIAKKAA